MNKFQWITLAVAVFNLALIGLFPPFDHLPLASNAVGAFQGFGFAFADDPARSINTSFLQIEVFVVAVNAAIAWLLLRGRPSAAGTAGGKTSWEKPVLAGVAVNLLLVLLFPPMQFTYAVTRAALPSFQGFYFVFGGQPNMAIVVELLYLEVIFVLVNGGLLYLLFRRSAGIELTAEMRAKLAAELRSRR